MERMNIKDENRYNSIKRLIEIIKQAECISLFCPKFILNPLAMCYEDLEVQA